MLPVTPACICIIFHLPVSEIIIYWRRGPSFWTFKLKPNMNSTQHLPVGCRLIFLARHHLHIFLALIYKFAAGAPAVEFTYEVVWEQSPIRWASRWDPYLAMSDVQIHWFSIINSVVVVFFLAGKNEFDREWSSIINSSIVSCSLHSRFAVDVSFCFVGILTMIIVRTLRRDIAKYNKMDEEVCVDVCVMFISSFSAMQSCAGWTLAVNLDAVTDRLVFRIYDLSYCECGEIDRCVNDVWCDVAHILVVKFHLPRSNTGTIKT